MIKKSFILFLFLTKLCAFGQSSSEIRNKLSRAKGDSLIGDLYADLSAYYLNVHLDSAVFYADSSLFYAERSKIPSLILLAKLGKGIAFQTRGNLDEANVHFFEVLKETDKYNLPYLKGKALNGIGMSFATQGRLKEALPYFEQCIKIFKEYDEKHLSVVYMNIGNIHYTLSYNDSIKDFSKSYEYYYKALDLANKYNIITQQVTTLSNLGLTAADDGKPKEALVMLFKALDICEKNGLHAEKIWIYLYMGRAYRDLKNYEPSEIYFKKSIAQAVSLGNIDYASSGYNELAETYFEKENYEEAYIALARHKSIEDSLLPINTQEQLNELQTRYQTEKKQQQIELLQLNANRDKWIKYSLIVVAILVLVSAIMFYSRYKLKARSNQLLEQQNKIINQKNKDITDSINYANLIQKALLPQPAELKQSFNDLFILNLPRDIVSGDFYWHHKKDNLSFLAVADCTGHGVPGAMMSTAGSSLINQIIIEKNCLEPDEILNQLRNSVINLLKQNTGTNENRDGMDIALIRFDHLKNELVYSGANNPIYHIRNGKLEEYKASKQPIGYFSDPKPFTQTTLKIENGDSVYLFSDGYADQFGGPDGKKFKYSRLKESLLNFATLSSEDQKRKMTEIYTAWKGSHEQVDDVLLAGIKFQNIS